MSVTKVPYGKPIKLLVDYQGYPDGRIVLFEIWRKKGGEEEKIFDVYGVTKGGKGIGHWIPEIERKETLPLEKENEEVNEEEKYYFIAKIDDKEVKSGEMMLTYLLEIYLEDEEGVPIDKIEGMVTFSNGSKKKGVVKNGRLRFEDAIPGKFKLELEMHEFVFKHRGKIVAAQWGQSKCRCGDEVKIIVVTQDFDDGSPARFAIWEEHIDGTNHQIEQIEAKVQKNHVETFWKYSLKKLEEYLKEEEDVEEEEAEPKYFFSVDINGEKTRSDVLTFTYPLDIYLEDEDKKPLEDVEYKITFSDGTEKKGKFKEGYAKIADAPYGKFTLEVEGYIFLL